LNIKSVKGYIFVTFYYAFGEYGPGLRLDVNDAIYINTSDLF